MCEVKKVSIFMVNLPSHCRITLSSSSHGENFVLQGRQQGVALHHQQNPTG